MLRIYTTRDGRTHLLGPAAGSSARDDASDEESESAAITRAPSTYTSEPQEVEYMRHRIAQLELELAAALRAAPAVPHGIKCFLAARFRPAWALMLNVFPKAVAFEVDAIAQDVEARLASIHRDLLLPFLFDEANWHPGVKGGGPHYAWSQRKDGFNGTGRSGWPVNMVDEQGEAVRMPGYDGMDYETRRQPMVEAFCSLQVVAHDLVDRVQELAGRVFGLITRQEQLGLQLESKDGHASQPVPLEYEGKSWANTVLSPEAALACRQAAALIKEHTEAGTLESCLYIAADEGEYLYSQLSKREFAGEEHKIHLHFVYARSVLGSRPFHEAMHTCLSKHADILHATIKSMTRGSSKVQAEYSKEGLALPESRWLKDVLRVTGEVDDYRAMKSAVAKLAADFPIIQLKVRLEEDTHDVVAVIEFNGILAEVQFSFRSVLLMKSFAHTAYTLARLDLDAPGGFNHILDVAFKIPKLGVYWAGGYSSRSPSDIERRLQL